MRVQPSDTDGGPRQRFAIIGRSVPLPLNHGNRGRPTPPTGGIRVSNRVPRSDGRRPSRTRLDYVTLEP
jgi:hypothetical protein